MAGFQSKITTYLLIVIVAAVWGVIVKKMFFPKSDKEVCMPIKKNISPVAPDTIALKLDYRDPFQPKATVRRVASVGKPVSHLPPAKPVRINDNIKVLGKLTCEGLSCYIVEVNNIQYTVSAGEFAGDYKLISEYADSLCLDKNGITRTVSVK